MAALLAAALAATSPLAARGEDPPHAPGGAGAGVVEALVAGRRALAEGRTREAEEAFGRAVEESAASGDDAARLAAAAALGGLLAEGGRWSDAEAVLRPVLPVADRAPDATAGAAIRVILARAAVGAGRPGEALPLAAAAADAVAARGAASAVGVVAEAYLAASLAVEDSDAVLSGAVRDLCGRLAPLPGFGGTLDLARALYGQGVAALGAADAGGARRLLDLAVRVARSGADDGGEGFAALLPEALGALGHSMVLGGDPEGRRVIEEGLARVPEGGRRSMLLANLALAQWEEGDPVGAAARYAEAADAARTEGESGRAASLGVRRGEALRAAGRLAAAEDVLAEVVHDPALSEAERAGVWTARAIMDLERSGHRLGMRLFRRALESHPRVADGGPRFPDAAALQAAGWALGAAGGGDPDAAPALALRALDLASRSGSPEVVARVAEVVAETRLQSGGSGWDRSAEEACRASQGAAREAGMEAALWRSFHCLGRARAEAGDAEGARLAWAEAAGAVARVGIDAAWSAAGIVDRPSPAGPFVALAGGGAEEGWRWSRLWHSLLAAPPAPVPGTPGAGSGAAGAPSTPAAAAPGGLARGVAVVSLSPSGTRAFVARRDGVVAVDVPPGAGMAVGDALRGARRVVVVPDGARLALPLAGAFPGLPVQVALTDEDALALAAERTRWPGRRARIDVAGEPLRLDPYRPARTRLPEVPPGGLDALILPGVMGDEPDPEAQTRGDRLPEGRALASALAELGRRGVRAVLVAPGGADLAAMERRLARRAPADAARRAEPGWRVFELRGRSAEVVPVGQGPG